MPIRNFKIYEVDNAYPIDGTGPGGADPVILDILVMTVDDNNNRLQPDPASAGPNQIISIGGVQVDDFEFIWDDDITINGTEQAVKTFTLTINGTLRSFIMDESTNNIPGAAIGDSFELDSYSNYTNLRYRRVACFLRGTMIATETGERAIETLAPGDRVFTKDHGFQPIRWIGRSTLSRRKLLHAEHLRPVLIPAGAMGSGLPIRDLKVSQQHRVLLEGPAVQLHLGLEEALAPAVSLTGHKGIRVIDDCRPVDYFHMMFDRHEVVFGEGLASESFMVGATIRDEMEAAQLAEIIEIFPELGRDEWRGLEAARPILRRFEVAALAA